MGLFFPGPIHEFRMGISRNHWHKRRATGGKRAPIRAKRKFEIARPAAMTKLGPQRIHSVRTRGGNKKHRALRLDQGNFAWASEAITRKTRIIDKKRSKKTQQKYDERQKTAKVEQSLEDQFQAGRVLAAISSRPGQCGRSDGYILEGKELEFYLRKIKSKKGR